MTTTPTTLDELLDELCPTCSDPLADHDGGPCQPTEGPPGYPITPDGWVTFQRVRRPGGRGVFLVQKRAGCTRVV